MVAQLKEASELFRRAADAGIADASYQLGRLYEQVSTSSNYTDTSAILAQ
jgi:TPR repeat protein